MGADLRRSVAWVEPKVESAMETPDGYWRVEVIRYGHRERWFRVIHGTTVLTENAAIGTVEYLLGDAYADLAPVPVDRDGAA
jgi:hypothetical protein